MKLLLDTHVCLWLTSAREKFSRRIMDILTDPGTELFFSAASAWELAIKIQIGKLKLSKPLDQWVQQLMTEHLIKELVIEVEDSLSVVSLPAHHKDPFDRLLIVQAMRNRLTLFTHDEQIMKYDVPYLSLN